MKPIVKPITPPTLDPRFGDAPGTSAPHVIAALFFQEPRRPSDLVPSLAPKLDRSVLACLEKDPAERPSAASVAASLGEVL